MSNQSSLVVSNGDVDHLSPILLLDVLGVRMERREGAPSFSQWCHVERLCWFALVAQRPDWLVLASTAYASRRKFALFPYTHAKNINITEAPEIAVSHLSPRLSLVMQDGRLC
jgi:hypothetical protein